VTLNIRLERNSEARLVESEAWNKLGLCLTVRKSESSA